MNGYDYDDDYRDRLEFAEPGGRSALRAASNKLTPADRAHGYQCDECADRAERGTD